jgi:serine/threonine protein kinase
MVPFYCTVCGAANQAQSAFCFACGKPLQAATPSPQYPVAGAGITILTGFLPSNVLLKQRYRIICQVGKGGFGAVYKAEDLQFGNRLLAVKEMSLGKLSPEEFAEAADAFKHEALLLAGLKHPNLPSIYDHFSEDGRWYLAMDFIEGETLEEHLTNAQEKLLPVQEVLQIGIQLCTVLSYLHTRQPTIVFRDLKPANVIMTPEGHIYLIDFGIARHFKPGQTKDTIAFGSLGYAAPEQYGKTQSTPRTDIYSLGVTLHQLLTGNDPTQTPFQFSPLQLQGQPTSPELESLIMQMLEINVNKRPDSMAVVKQELQRIATWKSALSPSSSLSAAQTSVSGVDQAAKKQLLDTSNDLYKAKRYQETLLACEQALQLDPNDASIYNLKGDVLSDLKRYEEALIAFEQAIQLNPGTATAYKNKGNALADLKRYEEALAAYKQSIQLDPQLATAHSGMGYTLINLKRYREALSACEQALQLDPNLRVAYNNKCLAFMNLKQYEEALVACEQALQLDPNDAVIMANKGGALLRLKRYDEALATSEQALRLDPSNAEIYNLKGVVLHDIKRFVSIPSSQSPTITKGVAL